MRIFDSEEISRLREMAQYQSGIGSNQDILTWAQVAGVSRNPDDFSHFMRIVHDYQENPFRQVAMVMFIRLLLASGDFNRARQAAAVLCNFEHYVPHVLARLMIAKYSGDQEDNALAEEFLRELYKSHSATE